MGHWLDAWGCFADTDWRTAQEAAAYHLDQRADRCRFICFTLGRFGMANAETVDSLLSGKAWSGLLLHNVSTSGETTDVHTGYL